MITINQVQHTLADAVQTLKGDDDTTSTARVHTERERSQLIDALAPDGEEHHEGYHTRVWGETDGIQWDVRIECEEEENNIMEDFDDYDM